MPGYRVLDTRFSDQYKLAGSQSKLLDASKETRINIIRCN